MYSSTEIKRIVNLHFEVMMSCQEPYAFPNDLQVSATVLSASFVPASNSN